MLASQNVAVLGSSRLSFFVSFAEGGRLNLAMSRQSRTSVFPKFWAFTNVRAFKIPVSWNVNIRLSDFLLFKMGPTPKASESIVNDANGNPSCWLLMVFVEVSDLDGYKKHLP